MLAPRQVDNYEFRPILLSNWPVETRRPNSQPDPLQSVCPRRNVLVIGFHHGCDYLPIVHLKDFALYHFPIWQWLDESGFPILRNL